MFAKLWLICYARRRFDFCFNSWLFNRWDKNQFYVIRGIVSQGSKLSKF